MRIPSLRPLLVAAALTFLVSGCDSGRLLLPSFETTRNLAEARAQWTAMRATNYEFTLQRLCFCGGVQPMRVTVRNGTVQSVVPEGELLPLPANEAQWYPSIEGLLDIIERALAMSGSTVDAEFDRTAGYPRRAAIDPIALAVDDEVTYLVTNVRIL